MEQTPAHEHHNPDLLRFIPADARHIIEIGCSSGALAREFKKIAPTCDYLGVDVDPAYAALAQRYCDSTLALDVEQAGDEFWRAQATRACWVFGDVLEHLKDPWAVLRKIRAVIPAHGVVVACIPNVQHWSIQARLASGSFDYQAEGLMDKTHLRWFTRASLIKMFDETGFKVTEGMPRVFDEPQREKALPVIEQMARLLGADPKQAVADALPIQYVVKAVVK
ncbi:MAG: class I SAM-dependent methyltransferase [Rhodospirillaceae bacterium]|nr:class I SAM-dependent methyltransferase [Rhodospirillaceae bacterium]